MRWELEIGLVIMVLGLTAVSLWLLLCLRQARQRQVQLLQQIQRFLEHPETPAYSVSDDDLASLENAVADLETRMLQMKERSIRESRHHADFVADIAHQLKTPLAAMRLFCELDDGRSPHQAEQLELTLRMEKLIQALLRMEKLKSDVYQLKYEPCDLPLLVGQVWAELQPLFPDRVLDIRGEAMMRLDPDWMAEALQNILKNACEQPAENPAIELTLVQSEAAVTLSLTDHGGGLPADALLQIFARFHRATHKAVPESSGLGLAITRTIVEKHHGTILAENHQDGLRITICLPILDGRRLS